MSEYEFLYNLHNVEINNKENDIENKQSNSDNYIYLRFDITDTGCGIDSSDYLKLFKSFSQIDNRLTSKIYQGTGLGLAISKELVELMNGCIWLDWSEVSKGSRFSFILKVEIANDDSVQYTENEQDILLLKNKNVLILDDNLYNRISLAGIISKWGMKAYSYSNTEEALYFSKITNFDIGLIDICMPKIDGPTFASKLREQNEFNNKTFPLIALSSIGDKVTSISKYFKMHLVKPIKEQKLKHICIEALKQYGSNTIKLLKPKDEDDEICQDKTLDSYLIRNDISELKDNVRILLAEDIHINQKVITSFLNKMGFHNIQVVDNGQQCLDLIHQTDFEIVLLDIRMPVMNGEVALKNIIHFYNQKESSTRRKPYIVAVTAYCLKEDKEKYLNMGFDDYIPKPISYNELLTCMNNYIQNLLNN
jgi:CheY-like chemotaxis protein